MPRVAVAVLTLSITTAAAVADAEPIRLTDGALVGDDFSARLQARSADGRFAIEGFGDRVGGIYGPAESCNTTPDCGPSASVALDALWSGSDFPGTATVDGTSYTLSGGNHASAFVNFTGSWQTPAYDGRTTATVIVPFLFDGSFFYPSDSSAAPMALTGSGIATLNLRWGPFDSWLVQSTRYQFAGAQHAPEPMSVVLIASGTAGLLLRRRPLGSRSGSRRRHQNT